MYSSTARTQPIALDMLGLIRNSLFVVWSVHAPIWRRRERVVVAERRLIGLGLDVHLVWES